MNNKMIPDDYHDYLYRFTYWMLSPIAPHVPKSMTPNQISLAAFISAMTGNILLLSIKTPSAYLYWVLFNFIWFLLDALDGMHARLSNQSSEYGGFLDHSLDNVYFLFMLMAIAIKFDMTSVLYIYIFLLRVTASLMVFTVQCHTKRLYVGRFTGGLEFLLLNSAMILSACFAHTNPMNWTHNTMLLYCMNAVDLQTGVFMKLAFLPYFIGVPINIILQFRFVRRLLR